MRWIHQAIIFARLSAYIHAGPIRDRANNLQVRGNPDCELKDVHGVVEAISKLEASAWCTKFLGHTYTAITETAIETATETATVTDTSTDTIPTTYTIWDFSTITSETTYTSETVTHRPTAPTLTRTSTSTTWTTVSTPWPSTATTCTVFGLYKRGEKPPQPTEPPMERPMVIPEELRGYDRQLLRTGCECYLGGLPDTRVITETVTATITSTSTETALASATDYNTMTTELATHTEYTTVSVKDISTLTLPTFTPSTTITKIVTSTHNAAPEPTPVIGNYVRKWQGKATYILRGHAWSLPDFKKLGLNSMEEAQQACACACTRDPTCQFIFVIAFRIWPNEPRMFSCDLSRNGFDPAMLDYDVTEIIDARAYNRTM